MKMYECLTEYDEEKYVARVRADGNTEGLVLTLMEFVNDGRISQEEAAEAAEDFRKNVKLHS